MHLVESLWVIEWFYECLVVIFLISDNLFVNIEVLGDAIDARRDFIMLQVVVWRVQHVEDPGPEEFL